MLLLQYFFGRSVASRSVAKVLLTTMKRRRATTLVTLPRRWPGP